MRRLPVLICALLLTTVTAAPASASKPIVYFDDDYAFEVLVDPGWGWFECGFDVIYGGAGHESYKEWTDKVGDAVKGLYQNQGIDYFYAEANPSNVVSGKFRLSSHLSDFVEVEPGLFEWDERVTGRIWGITLPGSGPVFHEAGQIWQHVRAEEPEWVYTRLRQVGISVFDDDALCAALDPS
jgi:hypothetical protein